MIRLVLHKEDSQLQVLNVSLMRSMGRTSLISSARHIFTQPNRFFFPGSTMKDTAFFQLADQQSAAICGEGGTATLH